MSAPKAKRPKALPKVKLPAGAVCRVNPDLWPFLVLVTELAENPKNARLHGDESVDGIGASLEQFEQNKPIVVRKGGIVAGHGMFAAARKLGWTHVAATEFEGTKKQAVGFGIDDNRTAELSTWDEGRLASQVMALPADLDIDPFRFGDVVAFETEQGASAAAFLDGSVDREQLGRDPMMKTHGKAPPGHAFFEAYLTKPQNDSLFQAIDAARLGGLGGPIIQIIVELCRRYPGQAARGGKEAARAR